MLDTRRRIVALAAIAALSLAACSGSDEPTSSPTDKNDADTTAPPRSLEPENGCTPDIATSVPETLDPDECWTVPNATSPVFVDDTVFVLADDPNAAESGEAAAYVAAYEAESGTLVWTSEALPGEVRSMAAAEADGEPAIAVLVIENDEGDAVTEASEAWGYLAWPADVDEDSPTEAPVHITTPIGETSSTDVRWTDQGILAGDQLLRPGATAFEQVNVAPDPVVIGDYDLDETLVGVSGDQLLSYVSGVAWTEGGSEDGDTYLGWVARGADATQTWDFIASSANQAENAIFAEGPARMPIVIGEYALTVIPTDETYTTYQLEWFDAATGDPATPTPADLAGAMPIGGAAAVMTNNVAALLAPSAEHLFVYWSTLALVIDIEAGTVKWVDTDFEITGTAIDDTTVYGRTENGTVTIDLATATATAQKEGTEPIVALVGDYGAFTVADTSGSGTEYLVVARRR
jgi:hypothetical protein